MDFRRFKSSELLEAGQRRQDKRSSPLRAEPGIGQERPKLRYAGMARLTLLRSKQKWCHADDFYFASISHHDHIDSHGPGQAHPDAGRHQQGLQQDRRGQERRLLLGHCEPGRYRAVVSLRVERRLGSSRRELRHANLARVLLLCGRWPASNDYIDGAGAAYADAARIPEGLQEVCGGKERR